MNLEFIHNDYQEVGKMTEIYLKAIRKNGLTLQFVPADSQTHELCLEAVKQNGSALRFVITDLQTKEICVKAVQNNILALRYIKQIDNDCKETREKMKDVYLAAIKQNANSFKCIINYMNPDLITKEMCFAAIKSNPRTLEWIHFEDFDAPEEYNKLCLLAIQQNGLVLEYIKPENQTFEMCLAAFNQNKKSLKYMDKKFYLQFNIN